MGPHPRWRTAVGLALVAFWAAGLAPLDHHAAEIHPGHDHLVLTARGATWALVVPAHAHGGTVPHTHRPPAAGPAGAPALLTVPPTHAAAVMGLAGAALHAPAPTRLAHDPLQPQLAPPSSAPRPTGGLAWAPADPPPRPA